MEESDDSIAPMVDGLSSGLCILILICTVFMISTIATSINVEGARIRFPVSVLDLKNNRIFYKEGVNLVTSDRVKLIDNINQSTGKELKIYGYQKDGNNDKLIFNILYFQKMIGKTDKEMSYFFGNEKMCGKNNSCILWEIS